MAHVDKLSETLPANMIKSSQPEEKKKQTIRALSIDFRESVKAKSSSVKTLEKIIQEMSIKDINDIFYNDEVPSAPGRCYYEIIEEFLWGPDYFKDDFKIIVDGYISIVGTLLARIHHLQISGQTNDTDDYRASTANYLDARLTSIYERTKLFISVQNEFGELHKDISDAKTNIDDLSEKVNNIDTTSDQIMPNIISLLGVFSSVIVVILSLITTSSTWLSNANEPSIITAFVVPTGIIVLSICALTAIVQAMLDKLAYKKEGAVEETEGTVEGNAWHKIGHIFQKWGIWLVVATVASLVVCSTLYFSHRNNNSQTHYLVKSLPMSETKNDSESTDNQSISDSSNQELFIVQDIILPTGEKYSHKLTCEQDDINADGYVYYCLLHQCFE